MCLPCSSVGECVTQMRACMCLFRVWAVKILLECFFLGVCSLNSSASVFGTGWCFPCVAAWLVPSWRYLWCMIGRAVCSDTNSLWFLSHCEWLSIVRSCYSCPASGHWSLTFPSSCHGITAVKLLQSWRAGCSPFTPPKQNLAFDPEPWSWKGIYVKEAVWVLLQPFGKCSHSLNYPFSTTGVL